MNPVDELVELVEAPQSLIEDPTPSTYDVPLRPTEDDLLETLKRARDRIEKGHSVSTYVHAGEVCAVGGVVVASGFTTKSTFEAEAPKYALDALKLLDQVAEELYPDLMGCFNNPKEEGYKYEVGDLIEDVNQASTLHLRAGDTGYKKAKAEAKEKTLHCYDKAIERREAQING